MVTLTLRCCANLWVCDIVQILFIIYFYKDGDTYLLSTTTRQSDWIRRRKKVEEELNGSNSKGYFVDERQHYKVIRWWRWYKNEEVATNLYGMKVNTYFVVSASQFLNNNLAICKLMWAKFNYFHNCNSVCAYFLCCNFLHKIIHNIFRKKH